MMIRSELKSPVRWSNGWGPLQGLPTVRSWDLAGTKPDPNKSAKNGGDPDFTRGTLCSYDRDTGNFYIQDMKSMRDRSALVNNLIMKTAREDSKDVYPIIPQDSGSAGKEVAETKRTNLLNQGYKPIIIKAPRGGKLKAAENFLIACQEGRVFVVKGVFSDGNYAELENFDGNKSNGWHDDVMDSLSQAYNAVTSGRLIPTIKVSRDNPRLNNLFGKTLL
ncbi:phage terminase large subunit family protein [Chromohalobacter israelensis]|uniref:phage terminase large subunit family protein n=1 Tax=Chromohalobacter israelensis TaxID=141390 RepID=UPI000D716972|nr:hypothetical protein [Chromohalobacter salexigens]PWW33406.1 putative phage terminase large subunit-like protein [Chromohalobacter salexigens]